MSFIHGLMFIAIKLRVACIPNSNASLTVLASRFNAIIHRIAIKNAGEKGEIKPAQNQKK
ncbi:MAG: hypothetical protein JKY19_13890 [Alcanivoracaceae bacterium]|nr:hypothetical protein [Alcanivoracaceae bacterium]